MAGNHMKKIFKTIAIKEMQIKTSGIGKKNSDITPHSQGCL